MNKTISYRKRNLTVHIEGYRGTVELYDTTVFERNYETVILRTGGYVTQSTKKAINLGFTECDIPWEVSLTRGEFIVRNTDTGKTLRWSVPHEENFELNIHEDGTIE